MPSLICTVTPGARNFSGVSRNEIASTMPSQTKTTAVASDVDALTAQPRSSKSARRD
jgi:hypothetical protein